MFNEPLLTEKETAVILGITPGTLTVWRCTKRYNIPFVKVGRSVRYRRESIQTWIDERTHNEGV